jgi:hypothetical protein
MQLNLTDPEAQVLRHVLDVHLLDVNDKHHDDDHDERIGADERRTLASIAARLDEAAADAASTMSRMVQITSVLTEYD